MTIEIHITYLEGKVEDPEYVMKVADNYPIPNVGDYVQFVKDGCGQNLQVSWRVFDGKVVKLFV